MMFEQLYQFVTEQIGRNDLIAGGAVLGILAYAFSYLRSIPFLLAKWTRFLFLTEVDVPDRSSSFRWVSDWLSKHPYTAKARRITAEASKSDSKITPAPGRHLIWWRRRPILINRIRRESTGDMASRAYRESWSISMFGRRAGVEDFLKECQQVSEAENRTKIEISLAERGYWENDQTRNKRPLETVILPETVMDTLVADLTEFIEARSWYESMNIPWRRGYLLYGPPGNGKSSIITAVASEIDFTVCIVNLRNTNEDDLTQLLTTLPDKSILLLEDIDCAFEEREGHTAISLSTILNLIDGVNATEGHIVFMTTNHPEKLDTALIRPGRIDLSVEIPNPGVYQIEKLYERFYPECPRAKEFAEQAAGHGVSMASVQGHFLQNRGRPEAAHASIKELTNGSVHNLE